MARYILHPGYVISKKDGERHFVGVLQLKSLYRLTGKDTVVPFRKGITALEGDIHLYPKADGDYTLPGRVGGLYVGETGITCQTGQTWQTE